MSNKLRIRGIGVLITVVVLTLIILVNIFVGMLTDRFFIRADLTETGVFTLSDRAAEFLNDLDETVDIIVLSEESIWRANPNFDMVANILQNYSASSGGRLRIQYVNPDLNSFDGPLYNNSLSDLQAAYMELEDMDRNDIIFLSERRATRLSVFDLFAQRQDQQGRVTVTLRADQELISSLIYVLNEEIARVVFVENHRESPLLNFTNVFERGGYVASTINLATEEIPDDTIVLVSAAPLSDFLSEEIVKLEEFLMHGGSVIILYDPQLPSLPNLENFMAEWGITIENKLIFDDEFTFVPQFGIIGAHVVAGDGLPSTANAEEITSVFRLGVRLPRPLRSDAVVRGGFRITPLVQTISASSYAKDISAGDLTTPAREPGDESGPFVLAYHVSRSTRNADGNQVDANLIVAGFSKFDDFILGTYGDTFYNAFLINDIAHDLNPFGERIFIPARELTGSQMMVSSGSARTILIVMVIALPLAIIATGIVVWRKRRHK
ncbi:MAG: GldG family protein [Oscillospiraceae bacterium]|nr:GldG family protein [Oscillospiraceae bacterium]